VLDLNEIERLLIKHGGSDKHEVQYSICYFLPKLKQHIYINKQSGSNYSGLVIHPRYRLNRDNLLKVSGVHSHEELNHKSSYRKFPKRYNRGKDKIPYGIPFGFESEFAFDDFINALEITSPLYTREASEEIASAESDGEFKDLTETERDSVVKSRRGQGKFRDALVKLWAECSVTKCKNTSILKASHIKPWKDSDNNERLDVYNGLLLTPNLDALFDGGLISFKDSGEVILSSFLDGDTLNKLGVTGTEILTSLSNERKKYMQYHRDVVFQQ